MARPSRCSTCGSTTTGRSSTRARTARESSARTHAGERGCATMSARFDDRWLSERILFPDSRAGADAVLSLYKDKSVIESVSPVETLYSVVPDTLAATRGDTSLERNLQEQFGLRLDQVASYHQEDV